MNQKIIFIGTILAIAAISIPMAIHYTSDKTPQSTFELKTQDDLTEIVDELVNEMYEKEIFLSMRDVSFLAGLDMDQIRLPPNKMDGYSGGKGTWHDGYSLHKDTKDGTRIWEEFSTNGTLLKSIKIYDEPEKDILILLK